MAAGGSIFSILKRSFAVFKTTVDQLLYCIGFCYPMFWIITFHHVKSYIKQRVLRDDRGVTLLTWKFCLRTSPIPFSQLSQVGIGR